MQMKKEIQFIFDEGEDKRNEDDDSLKILVLWNCCFLLFHFFYLLLDGLRSNGRLNNFINTPIKRQKWGVEDDEDKKWVRSGRDWWLKWKKAPKAQSYNWNLYSSANFLTSLLSLTLISIDSPAFTSLLRWFEGKVINNFYLLPQCFFGSSCFWKKSLTFLINFHCFALVVAGVHPKSRSAAKKRKITAMDGDFFNETSHQMLSGAINSFTWYIRYFSFLLFLLLLVCLLHFSCFFFGELFNVFIARVRKLFFRHKTPLFIEIYFSAVRCELKDSKM